ncbi:MAG: ABC transporter permease [Bacteroidia bacterium]
MKKATLNTLLTAFYSLRVNKLRAIITMLIIALGIASLVGMQTAIDGLKWSLVNNLNSLGNNTFSISKDANPLKFGGRRRVEDIAPDIDYRQANAFSDIIDGTLKVSVSVNASTQAKARFKNNETNPNIAITAGDINYLESSGFELEAGRNFTQTEIQQGINVAVIGRELNNLLFSENFLGIDKQIFLNDIRYTVIGVTKEKGSSFGISLDKMAAIPMQSARKNFAASMGSNYGVKVTVPDVFSMDQAIAQATGAMRIVRKLKPGAKNNFAIQKSESLQDLLEKNLSFVSYAAVIIGLITLSGALIALMNIMFVTVTERTKEIGTRMAVGASSGAIRFQFLSEATVISLLGGAFGIVLGLLIGNAVITFLNLDANIPYQWIFISFVLCAFVGVGAGFLPARKAASLDPIESLRYE